MKGLLDETVESLLVKLGLPDDTRIEIYDKIKGTYMDVAMAKKYHGQRIVEGFHIEEVGPIPLITVSMYCKVGGNVNGGLKLVPNTVAELFKPEKGNYHIITTLVHLDEDPTAPPAVVKTVQELINKFGDYSVTKVDNVSHGTYNYPISSTMDIWVKRCDQMYCIKDYLEQIRWQAADQGKDAPKYISIFDASNGQEEHMIVTLTEAEEKYGDRLITYVPGWMPAIHIM